MERKKYLTLNDAAKLVSTSVRTLREMCLTKRLRAAKVGHKWYVTPGEIDRVYGKGERK